MAEPAGVQGDALYTLEPELTDLRYQGYKTEVSRPHCASGIIRNPKTAIPVRQPVLTNDIIPPSNSDSVVFKQLSLPHPLAVGELLSTGLRNT